MKARMKRPRGRRVIALVLACVMILCGSPTAFAEDYSRVVELELAKTAKEFTFKQGSPTMTFANVNPGDSIEQEVIITNYRPEKIELFIRRNSGSSSSNLADLLELTVRNESGGVIYQGSNSDVKVGSLASGKTYKLYINLKVPVSVDNTHVGASVSYIWEIVADVEENSRSSSASRDTSTRDTDTIDIDDEEPPLTGGENIYIPSQQTPTTELPKTGKAGESKAA